MRFLTRDEIRPGLILNSLNEENLLVLSFCEDDGTFLVECEDGIDMHLDLSMRYEIVDDIVNGKPRA